MTLGFDIVHVSSSDCRLVRIQLARRDTCERRKATPAETFARCRLQPRLALAPPRRVDFAAFLLRLFLTSLSDSFIEPAFISPLSFRRSAVRALSLSRRLKQSSVLIDRFFLVDERNGKIHSAPHPLYLAISLDRWIRWTTLQVSMKNRLHIRRVNSRSIEKHSQSRTTRVFIILINAVEYNL